jgi:SagB-type dehydrogenase family enzyme
MSPAAPPPEEGYVASTRWTDFLGWETHGRPGDDDPAENFHEASKNLSAVLPVVSPAGAALETDPTARATITRPVKRNPALPTVALPEPDQPELGVFEAIAKRRSRREFAADPLPLEDLSTLLRASYGARGQVDHGSDVPTARSVPSGGALYPLEIYPVVRNVEGLAPGLYHYDPLRHLLEVVREERTDQHLKRMIIPLPAMPEVAASCAVVLFVAGIFWRSRFKYGLRGYRWALIEAGHLGQNFVLAAQAQQISAVPYGGFLDRRVDEYLGLDGVNESVVYSLIAGSAASSFS